MIFSLIFAFICTAELRQNGYVEVPTPVVDCEALYNRFDAFINFLQDHPAWKQKLTVAKERFIRSKDRNLYSTDFFGLYDEPKRGMISFYYSTHLHDFIWSRYPEFEEAKAIAQFFDACREIQKPCGKVFAEAGEELGLEPLSTLLKVMKYLPSYVASKPHYDGSAFSLFLDSTDNESLRISQYSRDEYFSPRRENVSLLIPGALLTEFSIFPTPHIVATTGVVRYSTIAFAMRPNYTTPFPNLKKFF